MTKTYPAVVLALWTVLASPAARATVCSSPAAQLEAVADSIEELANATAACPMADDGTTYDVEDALQEVCEEDAEGYIPQALRLAEEQSTEVTEEERRQLALLAPPDVAVIAAYTASCFENINYELWRQPNLLRVPLGSRLLAARLYRALSRLPAYRGEVRRGATVEAPVLSAYQPGRVVTFRGLSSSSVDEEEAFPGNLTMRIRSATGRRVRVFSWSFEENEVLFLPFTRVRVLTRDDRQHLGESVAHVELEDLGPDLTAMLGIPEERLEQEYRTIEGELRSDIASCIGSGQRAPELSAEERALLSQEEFGLPDSVSVRGHGFAVTPCMREWIAHHAVPLARGLLREYGSPGCPAFDEVYAVAIRGIQEELARRYALASVPALELRSMARLRTDLVRVDLEEILTRELRRRDTSQSNVRERLRISQDRAFDTAASRYPIRDRYLHDLRREWPSRFALEHALEEILSRRSSDLDASYRERLRGCLAFHPGNVPECVRSGLSADVDSQLRVLERLERFRDLEAIREVFGDRLRERTLQRHSTFLAGR